MSAHESAFDDFSSRGAVEVLDFDVVAAFAKCSGKDFGEAAGPFPD
ncbi:hypothetical protein [Streptomyces sp. RPT161]|nr:hypothetical protein [Streptomyces sp. RPT161]